MASAPKNDLVTSRHGTVLESVEDIREQLSRLNSGTDQQAGVSGAAPKSDAQRFRPLLRPPTALLRVFDDGEDSSEQIRIRKAIFSIGRVEGDFVVPNDSLVSTKHAEICLRQENGQYAWYLKDLGSTNGTFVRVTACVLRPQQVVLIGAKRYQFVPGESPPASQVVAGTRPWQQLSMDKVSRLQPALVEFNVDGPEQRYSLLPGDNWVGRDPRQCSIVLDDPMVSPRHARVYLDSRGRWCIENAQSVNGVWAQIDEVPLGNGGYFQCGEQRFAIRTV